MGTFALILTLCESVLISVVCASILNEYQDNKDCSIGEKLFTVSLMSIWLTFQMYKIYKCLSTFFPVLPRMF